ncbi:hypothetical protein E4U43_008336, partial [Claviceps pusilla]
MRLSALPAVLLAGLVGATQADRDDDLKSITMRTHNLQQPYLDTDMQSRWFEFGGDTIIRTDSYVENHILTLVAEQAKRNES